jgi:hypothetical protein
MKLEELQHLMELQLLLVTMLKPNQMLGLLLSMMVVLYLFLLSIVGLKLMVQHNFE